jgi:hypothetical protein
LLLATTAEAGPAYNWVDTSGQFHFSDTPQASWTRVDLPGPKLIPAGVRQQPVAEVLASKAGLCTQRRQTLDIYRTADNLIERDALGSERQYSAKEKQKLISPSEQQVTEACGDAP